MNLKTLDTLIAMVIVLLVLSLVVQSLQSVVKKWFKLKSRSILDSLHDLFAYAQARETDAQQAAAAASRLVGQVEAELVKLGRVSLIRKNPMVDSIAKEDLLKILDRIDTGALKAEVDKWYETVMQSFEERYTRHMKTVALCISIFVVIFLNANVFEIYQNISTNDVLRNSIIAQKDVVTKRLTELGQEPSQPVQDERKQLQDAQKQLDAELARASSIGLNPVTREQVNAFFSALRHAPLQALKVILGWAIMVMLLSVGAPFWQDALESLFGIKNLLRKKSDTKNVEDVGGQPRV